MEISSPDDTASDRDAAGHVPVGATAPRGPVGVDANDAFSASRPIDDRSAAVLAIVGRYEALMQRLSEAHAPEFLEIATTMPQAKVLYLVAAATELHMSELVGRLGVSLSTISGLVDRLVDQGLAGRREDPADRRQVLVSITNEGHAFIDRFRELNARQLERLLDLLDAGQLATVSRALELLAGAADRVASNDPTIPHDPARKDAR